MKSVVWLYITSRSAGFRQSPLLALRRVAGRNGTGWREPRWRGSLRPVVSTRLAAGRGPLAWAYRLRQTNFRRKQRQNQYVGAGQPSRRSLASSRPIAVNSLFRPMSSLFAGQEFPVPMGQGICRNTLMLLRELTRRRARMAANDADSLLFSLFAGKLGMPILSPQIARYDCEF